MIINKIKVNGQLVGVFEDYNHLIAKYSSWLEGYPKNEKIICIDTSGNICNDGADFIFARNNELFPVEAYRLIRSSEEISDDTIKVHNITLYECAKYILVTGIAQTMEYSVLDKESTPVALLVSETNKNKNSAIPPSAFPVVLNTEGRSVEVLGRITEISEEHAIQAYPMKIVTHRQSDEKGNVAEGCFVYNTSREALLQHIRLSYKINIVPATTLLIKVL